ncbi:DDE-type integrase/transposase/recombinase [Ancylobacter sp. TS-1]|uniref:DDE-type integrase/transposase/recombinase n=1 Tax=Ancylobacter sp. TS-1 TaxID=1850374 RepID=UPI001265D5EA|nr:DDE-type integrase/transposase/recombinase [Ancylobacter sp. TS-1]QFR32424.1 DDE-type integrase/transposase/recombinase [Ancylobacter sp. TS-1]
MNKTPRHHECWVVDAAPLDALSNGHRPWIAIIIDAGSRTPRGHSTRSSQDTAVRSALSLAFDLWGAPARLRADAGCNLPEDLLTDFGVTVERLSTQRTETATPAERALRKVAP